MKKNFLEYRGFIGTVEFSTDDEIFFGKVEGIPGLVSFEGASIKELKKSFEDAVNHYEEICTKLKKPFVKSLKGSFNIRIKPELHQKAFIYAKQHGVSINQLVQSALEKQLVN